MPRKRNDEQHGAMRRKILNAARQQMQQFGTAGLGMRNIARELNLAPSGLYRYYRDLDAVITALILEAFTALAETIEAASHSLPREDYAGRLLAVLLAYRRWAQEHPIDFQLIYGNPIPGYQAPTELTLRAARRGYRVVVEILDGAVADGSLLLPLEYQHLPDTVVASFQSVAAAEDYHGVLGVLCLATVGWARIHGFVMLELFGSIQPLVGDAEAFYRVELRAMMQQLGFRR
ncbi:MAG: TetR/AcrR family transcriptional regulator [Anaerolineae bacterium]